MAPRILSVIVLSVWSCAALRQPVLASGRATTWTGGVAPLPASRAVATAAWAGGAAPLSAVAHLRRARVSSLRMSAEATGPLQAEGTGTLPAEGTGPSSVNASLAPIALGVFAQMLGEGIAISSLPLHMTSLGASPVLAGAATSCFSFAQMLCCPLLVRLSSRVGRIVVLRVCLAGATASSLLIAFSGNTAGIITGRCLAGVFAASVPVAQAAVTDVVAANETALALSRVSASSQLGVVVGPAASAILQVHPKIK